MHAFPPKKHLGARETSYAVSDVAWWCARLSDVWTVVQVGFSKGVWIHITMPWRQFLTPGDVSFFFRGGGRKKGKVGCLAWIVICVFFLKKRPFIYLDIQSISSCILHRLMRCDFNMTRDSRSWHIVLNTTISAAWLWPQFNWLNSLDLPKQQVVQRLLGHGMFRAVGDVGRRPRVVNRNSKCPLNMPFHQVGEGSPEYT